LIFGPQLTHLSPDAITLDDLKTLSAEQFDALPFGAIKLDPDGVVLGYNFKEAKLARKQRDEVIGKAFFVEVAPCTDNVDFRGRLDALAKDGGGTQAFDYVFAFAWGKRSVRMRILVDPLGVWWLFVTNLDKHDLDKHDENDDDL